jgi:hypothetical protein
MKMDNEIDISLKTVIEVFFKIDESAVLRGPRDRSI